MQNLMDRLITIFGDIKHFRYPFWMVYDPGSYKVRVAEMRTVGERLQPGDILLRMPRVVLGGFAERLLVEPDAICDTSLDFLYAPPRGACDDASREDLECSQ